MALNLLTTMKKILISLYTILFSCISFAQTQIDTVKTCSSTTLHFVNTQVNINNFGRKETALFNDPDVEFNVNSNKKEIEFTVYNNNERGKDFHEECYYYSYYWTNCILCVFYYEDSTEYRVIRNNKVIARIQDFGIESRIDIVNT